MEIQVLVLTVVRREQESRSMLLLPDHWIIMQRQLSLAFTHGRVVGKLQTRQVFAVHYRGLFYRIPKGEARRCYLKQIRPLRITSANMQTGLILCLGKKVCPQRETGLMRPQRGCRAASSTVIKRRGCRFSGRFLLPELRGVTGSEALICRRR